MNHDLRELGRRIRLGTVDERGSDDQSHDEAVVASDDQARSVGPMRARLVTVVAASLVIAPLAACGLTSSPSPAASCEQTLVSGGWVYRVADYDGPDPQIGSPVDGGAYYPPCNDGGVPVSGTATDAWTVVGQPDLIAVKTACAQADPDSSAAAGCDPNAPQYTTWKKDKKI